MYIKGFIYPNNLAANPFFFFFFSTGSSGVVDPMLILSKDTLELLLLNAEGEVMCMWDISEAVLLADESFL